MQKAGGTDYDVGYDLAIDGSGNSFITGSFLDTATFGNTLLTSNGNADVFIAKYDASGNVIWAQKVGGNDYDWGEGIAVDGSGNCYVTGGFNGTVIFGNTTFSSSGFTDIYIAKFDASGNVLWAQKAGGTDREGGNSIAADSSGNCYVTGIFNGTTYFGNTTLTSNAPDVFITKLGSSTIGLASDISDALSSNPNPFRTSFQISFSGSGPATVMLTDVLGREVHRQTIVPPAAESTVLISPSIHLPCGMYGLQIRQGETVKQGKVVKQ